MSNRTLIELNHDYTPETDAEVLAREFGKNFDPTQFGNLGNHHICAKLLQEGQHQEPFLGKTQRPIAMKAGSRDTVIRRSRERFTMSRDKLEEKLRRWIGR